MSIKLTGHAVLFLRRRNVIFFAIDRVCLWDIRKDTENMTILATLEKDVSVFSVRDVTRRTIPLIA